MSGPIVKTKDCSNLQVSHINCRRRKLRSVVWNDFTKELKENGCEIAICNHCKRKFKGSSSSGTTHLRNHLRSCFSYGLAKRNGKDIVRTRPVQLDDKSVSAIVVHEVDKNSMVPKDDGNAHLHEDINGVASNGQISNVAPISRQGKLRSLVWNDFTKEKREDGNLIATCNHCKKQMTGASSSGTAHLKKHLGKCVFYQRMKRRKPDIEQPLMKLGKKQKIGTANHESLLFDKELIQQDLARMIILHEYPFSIVNHVGFRTFVKDLQPQFELMSSDNLQVNCLKIYESKRLQLYGELDKLCCRVNLAADIWRSSTSVSYLRLSCHFIDDDWKLQHKVINFWHVDSSCEGEIAKLILDKLLEWHIDEKVFSIILDNSTTSDKVVQELLQSLRPKNSVFLDGSSFHVHSCSHIFNLIVQGGLEAAPICGVINRIRDGVTFVRASQERLKRFQTAVKQVGAPPKSLVVDVPSRWKSTYLMIATACEFQDAFFSLANSESESIHIPSSAEWDNLRSINECLRTFYLMTEKVSSSKSPTSNLCFNNVCGIHLSLKAWCISSHPLVSSMASKMLEQFEKYWGVTSTVLAAASILDPRYKMKSVEYFFKLIYTSGSEAEVKIENVLQAFRSLYNVYSVKLDKASKSGHGFSSKAHSNNDNLGADCVTNIVSESHPHDPLSYLQFGLAQYVQETSSTQPIKSDLDLYLEEAVHPSTKGHDDDDFDILAWWKTNAARYPILSAMAHDILGIPASIASPESGFNCRAKLLDDYHCSMDPVTLQGLICAQDWLRCETEDSALDGLPDGLSTIFTVASDLEGTE